MFELGIVKVERLDTDPERWQVDFLFLWVGVWEDGTGWVRGPSSTLADCSFVS